MRKQLLISSILTCAAVGVTLAGCGTHSVSARHELAQQMGARAGFQKRVITAFPFALTSFQRVSAPGGVARVYIEGDGLAWVGRGTPSLDPTPTNPIALALAKADTAANVVYLARPCQYTKMTIPKPCPGKYWTSHRFAPEVIASMNAAMDQIKQQNGFTGFELVGFSGGGAVATLIAARRDDVENLRTVAGTLDHGLVMHIHKVSPLDGSMDAVHVAAKTAHIPQMHFIGGKDHIITPRVVDSYKRAAGDMRCIQSKIIPGAAHEKGWSNVWPALLGIPLECSK